MKDQKVLVEDIRESIRKIEQYLGFAKTKKRAWEYKYRLTEVDYLWYNLVYLPFHF